MKTINRNTKVFSISLPQQVAAQLEEARGYQNQSRSAFVANLIERELEQERWNRIYQKGARTAQEFNITNEEDIDRIIHGA